MSIEKSPWQILNSIAKKDFIPDEDQIDNINSFWLCKWLSNDIRNIIVSEVINNNYKNMNNHSQYWFSRSCVTNVPFIKNNVSKKLEFKNKEEELLYKCIKIHYCFGDGRDKEIFDYMDMLGKNDRAKLIKKYSHLFFQKELKNILDI